MSELNLCGYARVAFTAYSQAVGGKAFNGDPLPTWEEFKADPTKTKMVSAWESAARAVLHLDALIKIRGINKSGFAGVLSNGNIVDRRIHPDAIPIPANPTLGIPEPKKVARL